MDYTKQAFTSAQLSGKSETAISVLVERVFKGKYHEVVIYNHDRTMSTNPLTVLSPDKGELKHLVKEARKLFKWHEDNDERAPTT